MFSHNVQVLPGKNEVVGELQPYIENVLRADDPMFWQKLRCENVFSFEKNFLRQMMSNFWLHSIEVYNFFQVRTSSEYSCQGRKPCSQLFTGRWTQSLSCTAWRLCSAPSGWQTGQDVSKYESRGAHSQRAGWGEKWRFANSKAQRGETESEPVRDEGGGKDEERGGGAVGTIVNNVSFVILCFTVENTQLA